MHDPAVADVVSRNNVRVLGNAEGRSIVFAHGFGCDQSTWRDVTPHFIADYRVVLFDHVGAGGSDLRAYDHAKYDSLQGYADDVVQLLDALDLTDVVFVGHSVSAMIGVLAAAASDRIGSLVLVGPSPRYVDDGDYRGGFTPADIESMLQSLDANYLGWSSTMAPVIVANPERPELGERLTTSFCAIEPTIARHFARVTFLSDNRADLASVTVPTLVLQCAQDVIAPDAVGQFVHRSIPGSTLVRLESTGHLPSLADPASLAEAILDYLR